jgi:hypothetical protein
LSIKARPSATTRVVTINEALRNTVLKVMRQAAPEPKRNSKFWKPIQALPKMPSLAR